MTGNLTCVILIILLQVTAVIAQTDTEKEKQVVKQADIDFSDYSKAHGFKDAFLEFMADDAVLLRDNSYPMEGAEKIREHFKNNKGGYTLTWTPTFTSISESLDLGYTYGIYELNYKDEKGNPKKDGGTYITIWKKQKDGRWKFVLDAGNQGLEPEK